MSALAISLWFVLAVVAALRVTSRLADELGRPLAWTLGLLAGLGSSTLPHGLAIALGAAQAPLVLAVFASLALVWLLRPSERALVPTALLHHAQPHGLALRLAWAALGLSVLLALVAFRHRVLAHPDGEWDSWAIWTLRARFLARGGAQAGLGPEVEHPDYPLLLPLLTAQGLALPKLSSSPLPPIAAGFVFTALGPLALGLLVARLRGHVAGLLAASSLLLLPFWVRSGADLYADVPLATLALAAAGTLALALETDSLRLLPLAGLLAGLAAWTKNEGALVLLGGVAALTLPLLRASTRSPRRLLVFMLGALGPLLVLIAFKLHLHVHNDLVDAARTHPLTALVLEGSRWARIGRHLGQLALTFTDWGLALLLLPLALALALGWPAARTQAARALGLALLVQLAGLLLAFLITPHDLDWHLDTALDRVLLQAVPALVLWLFLRLTAAPAHSA